MKINLNKSSLIRYSRQIVLKNVGTFGQKKIINSKVLIIGAGGLGCPVADLLARSGVGEIGIMDYDKVSLSNIHRQTLYTAKDVNKFKVDVVKKRLNLIKGRNLGTLKSEKLKLIDFNKNTKQDLEIIRKYLFENMYRSKEVIFEREKCSKVIMDLFNLYNNNLNLLPCDWQKKIKYSKSESPKRIIGDYISGMTDRFALNQHNVLVS